MFLLFLTTVTVVFSQPPGSFFPHHVGDRWDYLDYNTLRAISMRLTRDSIGSDGSNSLFYNNQDTPDYRIDTSYNVFWMPQTPALNFLRYKLSADSCEPWTIHPPPNFGQWAWVATVESSVVFGRPTVAKLIKYAPGNPCSLGSLEEHWLAAGFGLISSQQEPDGPISLMGCVIAGDTFGFLTSVKPMADVPSKYMLQQNYPNPFNPTTTIEIGLPEEAVVHLRMYDILGRQIATLAEGKLSAGTHRFVWDATDLAGGVYFGRFVAGGTVRTIKMLLAR